MSATATASACGSTGGWVHAGAPCHDRRVMSVLIYALVAVVVAAIIVAVLIMVLPGDRLERAPADVVPTGLPVDREIGADDLARVRLPVGIRGYRMVDTDAVLDRLTAELEKRDRLIAALEAADAHTVRPNSANGRPGWAATVPVADDEPVRDVDGPGRQPSTPPDVPGSGGSTAVAPRPVDPHSSETDPGEPSR